MLYTNAVFRRKDTEIEARECVVDKVIRLSGAEFDRFSHGLSRDWDFIRDNPIDTVVDNEGRYHCLLVVGDSRRDGILVNSEGSDYARYSAFIPNVESFLLMEQYPALAALNHRLADIVDFIVEESVTEKTGNRTVVGLQELEAVFGIDISRNNVLHGVILQMLENRPEIRDYELDKNELIIYREPKLEPLAEDLSDPSVTQLDMNVYGYDYDGMVPLGKDKALELYDKGHEVYLLYEDDTEAVAEDRSEVENFDGMFGIEHTASDIREQVSPFEVLILNWERYDKGEQAGEWLPLPTDADKLRALFERIGVDGTNDSYAIANVRMPLYELLRDRISKHDSLDELNMLASFWNDMEEFEHNKLQAILSSNVQKIGYGASSLINTLCDENFDAFRMIDASDYESLGRYWVREVDDKPDDISFREYGRQIVADEKGRFTEHGYIYFRYKDLLPEYDGVVPDEYKIHDAAIQGLKSKASERGSGEQPSVAEGFSDPSVTMTDMYAYGYSWDGMTPIGKELALELYDEGFAVFRLYNDDAEGMVDSRDGIETFDGLFGIETSGWVEQIQTAPIEVFIINCERQAKGENIGEWLSLPSDANTLHRLFERIGVDRSSDDAFSITAVRVRDDYIRDYVTKYNSIDELHMLASHMDCLYDFELETFKSILSSGVVNIGSDVSALINVLDANNFDGFRMIAANNYEELGRYCNEGDPDNYPNGISHAEYGRQLVAEEKGKFTEAGYIYFCNKQLSQEYNGVVTDEYAIVGEALCGLRPKTQERSKQDEKPSVVEKIREARTAPRTLKVKDEQTNKKNKGGQEL